MRDARCETRLESVEIEREVHRRVEGEPAAVPITHLDDFDAEALCLLALVGVHGADAHLHQTVGQTLLHNSRERTGVGVAVAFEFVVQVAMRVDMQNRQLRMVASKAAQGRIGDGVVATEHERPAPGVSDQVERRLDHLPHPLRAFADAEHQVAVVFDVGVAQVDAPSRPRVARLRPERLSDQWWRVRRPATVGGAAIVGHAKQRHTSRPL